jgi:hypothetical protein
MPVSDFCFHLNDTFESVLEEMDDIERRKLSDVATVYWNGQRHPLRKIVLDLGGGGAGVPNDFKVVDVTGQTNEQLIRTILDFYKNHGTEGLGDHLFFEGWNRCAIGDRGELCFQIVLGS